MIIVTRAECRLRPATKRVLKAPPSRGVCLHCTKGRDPKSEKDARAAWRASQNSHQRERGWRDIGYSFAFNNLGMVLEGRGWNLVAGAAVGYNRTFRHVVWQGTPGRDVPGPLAFEAIDWIVAEHDRIFGEGAVFGHRDVHENKPCPGDVIYDYITAKYGHRNPFRGAA